MIHNTEHTPYNNELLSPAEQAELSRIEVLLARAAARQSMPADLVDRVYRASAVLLGSTAVLTGRWTVSTEPARLIRPAPRTAMLASMWGRLALAASLALAFLAARPLLVAHQAQPLSPDMMLAMIDSGSSPLVDWPSSLNSGRGGDDGYLETMGIFDMRAGDVLDDVSMMLQSGK